MNLRTLKKLSKRAAPIFVKHYDLEVFSAKRAENYHGLEIRCPHKRGRFRCDCESHPLKGTQMVGGMSGYYEPELEEDTAWERLSELVFWGDRPETMTDAEWMQTMKIARTEPVSEDEIRAWGMESLAP